MQVKLKTIFKFKNRLFIIALAVVLIAGLNYVIFTSVLPQNQGAQAAYVFGDNTPGTETDGFFGLKEEAVISTGFSEKYGEFNSMVIDSSGTYGYVLESPTINSNVLKVDLSDLSLVSVLNPGIHSGQFVLIDDSTDFLYIGGSKPTGAGDPNARIARVPLNNFTAGAITTLDIAESTYGFNPRPSNTGAVIDAAAGYLYYGTNSNAESNHIFRIDLNDFTANGVSFAFLGVELECDGTSTNAKGTCTTYDYLGGNTLAKMGANNLDIANDDGAADGQPLCTDDLQAPNEIHVDDDNNCANGAGGAALLGATPLNATTEVTYRWFFVDLDGDDLLDDGEDLYYRAAWTTAALLDGSPANNLYMADYGNTTESVLAKIDLSSWSTPMWMPDVASNSLGFGNNSIYDGAIDLSSTPHYGYFGSDGDDSIIKVDLTNMTIDTTLTGLKGSKDTQFFVDALIDPANRYLYFNTWGDDTDGIVRIDLDNFASGGVTKLIPTYGENYFWGADIDLNNGFVYTSTDTVVGAVIKIDLSTFTEDANTVFQEDGYLKNLLCNSNTGFAYAVSDVDPARVNKIDLSTFSIVDSLQLFGIDSAETAVIDIDSTPAYLYLGTNTMPAKIAKINLTTFTHEATLTTSINSISAATLDASGPTHYAYFSGAEDIAPVNLATFTEGTVLNTGRNYVTAAVGSSGYAYFTTQGRRIDKIDLTTPGNPVWDSQLTLPSGDGTVSTSSLDDSNNLLYIGTDDTPQDLVVKVDLSTFTKIDEVGIPEISGTNWPRSIVFDGVNNLLYVGHNLSYVSKIDLTSFSYLGVTETLSSSQLSGSCLDSVTGKLYVSQALNTPKISKLGENYQGYMYGSKATLGGNNQITSFYYYSAVAGGNIKLALYDNAKNKLWQSINIPNVTTAGWQKVDVTSGVPGTLNLTAGDYYFVFKTDSTQLFPRQNYTGTPADGFYKAANFNDTFPATITGIGAPLETEFTFSFYGDYTTPPPVIGGSGSSGSSVTDDTTAPYAPTNIALSALATGVVDLTWTDPVGDDWERIVIQRDHFPTAGTVSDAEYAQVNPGEQMYKDTGLSPGETYKYRVRSQDDAGNLSTNTEIYSVTIPTEAGEVGEGEVTTPATPTTPTTPPTLIVEDPVAAPALPTQVNQGDIVQLLNPNNSTDPKYDTLYQIDNDNRRHAFPNAIVFESWYGSFDNVNVKQISESLMNQIPLGSNVIVRPGTWLVKIPTNDKVYAVEDYGVLQWISTETVAAALYGSDWNNQIIDIDLSLWNDYQVYPDHNFVDSLVHPDATIIRYEGDIDYFYIENGMKRYVSSAVFSNNWYQMGFVRVIPTSISYPLGTPMASQPLGTIFKLR